MPLTKEWQKSSKSMNNGTCVEVRQLDTDVIQVRNNADGDVLTFNHGEWDAFLAGVREGEFDF